MKNSKLLRMMYVVQEVDPVFAQSFLHLMQLSNSAADVDADIAALDLDFTIPGCPEAEMKVNTYIVQSMTAAF